MPTQKRGQGLQLSEKDGGAAAKAQAQAIGLARLRKVLPDFDKADWEVEVGQRLAAHGGWRVVGWRWHGQRFNSMGAVVDACRRVRTMLTSTQHTTQPKDTALADGVRVAARKAGLVTARALWEDAADHLAPATPSPQPSRNSKGASPSKRGTCGRFRLCDGRKYKPTSPCTMLSGAELMKQADIKKPDWRWYTFLQQELVWGGLVFKPSLHADEARLCWVIATLKAAQAERQKLALFKMAKEAGGSRKRTAPPHHSSTKPVRKRVKVKPQETKPAITKLPAAQPAHGPATQAKQGAARCSSKLQPIAKQQGHAAAKRHASLQLVNKTAQAQPVQSR